MARNKVNVPLHLVNQVRERLNLKVLHDIFIHIYGALEDIGNIQILPELVNGYAVYQNWHMITQLPGVPTVGNHKANSYAAIQLQPRQKIILDYAYAFSDVKATAGGFTYDWKRTTNPGNSPTFSSIFTASGKPTIANNANYGMSRTFVVRELFHGDRLRLDVTASNGASGIQVGLVGRTVTLA